MNPEIYQQTNESFDKTLVFHLGSRAGFFSEYNTMIQAIIYCLRNNIRFQLYSYDANFSVRRGWADFFLPFCPEQTSALHRVFNYRFPQPGIKFKIRKHLGGPLVKTLCKCNYLTYDLWEEFRAWKTDIPLVIPHINWEGSFRALCREIVGLTWRFQPDVSEQISSIIKQAQLPANYLGVHIRGGDKIKEYHGNPPADYMNKLKNLSRIRDVLVMTDDYRIFQRLCSDYPDWRFYTLENPAQQGYRHRANKRKTVCEKRKDYIRFFAGVEMMKRADYFVGTYSSNIGVFLAMAMQPERCHAVDYDQWRML